jgi:preprotein translocase subunit YajC
MTLNAFTDFALILPLAQQATTQTVETTTSSGAPGTAAPTTQKTQKPWFLGDYMPLILALIVLYFFVFRGKNSQEKKRTAMLNAMKKGDRIQTIGGILGTVVDVRETEVVVKVDENTNTKITFSRNAVHRVVEEEKK